MKLKVIPPAWLLLALLLMQAADRWLPLAQIFGFPLRFLGYLPLLAGLLIGLLSVNEFRKAATPLSPFEDMTRLVTSGPFAWSRNPIYLGMVLILCGAALLFGTLSPWLVLPAFVWLIQTRYVRLEERRLAAQFGERYLEYCRRVRRWV